MISFQIADYKIERIADAGLWLVTTEHAVDVSMLFWRAQEFYESPNPDFVGKSFTFFDYMRWYCIKQSDSKSFTYASDYEGYNVPGAVLERLIAMPCLDPNKFDLLMSQIAMEISRRQQGPFYLIGAKASGLAVIEHEIAHGLYTLVPEYRVEMDRHVAALDADRLEIEAILRKEGYGDAVLADETQAYMATGLLDEMEKYERKRLPFMQSFSQFRAAHINLP